MLTCKFPFSIFSWGCLWLKNWFCFNVICLLLRFERKMYSNLSFVPVFPLNKWWTWSHHHHCPPLTLSVLSCLSPLLVLPLVPRANLLGGGRETFFVKCSPFLSFTFIFSFISLLHSIFCPCSHTSLSISTLNPISPSHLFLITHLAFLRLASALSAGLCL